MLLQDVPRPRVSMPHACSAAFAAGIDVLTLCIEERRVQSLQMVYARGIIPIDMDDVESENVLPPIVKRPSGRPKKIRMRSTQEELPSRITSCSGCKKRGHNIRTSPDKKDKLKGSLKIPQAAKRFGYWHREVGQQTGLSFVDAVQETLAPFWR